MFFCFNMVGDFKSYVEKCYNDVVLVIFVFFGKIIIFGYYIILLFIDML